MERARVVVHVVVDQPARSQQTAASYQAQFRLLRKVAWDDEQIPSHCQRSKSSQLEVRGEQIRHDQDGELVVLEVRDDPRLCYPGDKVRADFYPLSKCVKLLTKSIFEPRKNGNRALDNGNSDQRITL